MTRNLVNITEYAKIRGVSRQAVYNALKLGKLNGARNGEGLIDVEIADRLWAASTDPQKGGDFTKPRPSTVIGNGDRPTLAESKTLEAEYKAKLAQIEYEEKSGKLVDADKVKKEAFKVARITRDAMLAIPDRLAAELAGITEPFAIHQKIMAEIRGAISEVSKITEGQG